MRANTSTMADNRPTAALLFLSLVTLTLLAADAEARSCGMMKPPAHMVMPMHPMHPMHRPIHHGKPMAGGYASKAMAGPSIVDVAKRAGKFDTLLAALEAADLTALLEGKGPFTLFAPTDDAFAQLPEGALQELLADKAKLIALLKYHLVPGQVGAAEILSRSTLKTASGQALPTDALGVVRADVGARNGVIHVVNKVLLPSA